MSVYKPQKSPYYQFDFTRKGRRFHGSTGCTSRRDAEQFEAREKRLAQLGIEAKPRITVDEACGIWWSGKGKRQRSHATSDYQIKNLIAGLGKSVALSDVRFADLDRYVAKRRAHVSDASVNREVQLARRIWKYADARGYDVPAVEWGKLILAEPKERVRELMPDEEKRLMPHLSDDLAALVEFANLSGQRKESIVTMIWNKVDLAEGRATVWVKGGQWHTFPLTPRMVAIIANRPKVGPRIFTYVCERPSPPRKDRPRRLKGERYPFSVQGWNRKWLKALKDAGIDDFRFHDLRHTRGTRMLRATGNLKAVQKLLGHADVTTTARYAHALEDDVRAGMLAAESRNSAEQAPDDIAENGRTSKARR